MSEFYMHDIPCPHCNHEFGDTLEFDENEFDKEGALNTRFERDCPECGKKFWFDADVRFEVEVNDIYEKKPRKELR